MQIMENHFNELVLKNRSYRRFNENVRIPMDTLRELVDLARQTPSSGNKQCLKYYLSNEPEENARIFAALGFAGYLPEWGGPKEGERPSAYIVMLLDQEISKDGAVDTGIAAQTIMLGAVDRGLGGVMVANIRKVQLAETLKISDQYAIVLVLALGKPVEYVQMVTMDEEHGVRYYRDAEGNHYVPKRTLDELIIS